MRYLQINTYFNNRVEVARILSDCMNTILPIEIDTKNSLITLLTPEELPIGSKLHDRLRTQLHDLETNWGAEWVRKTENGWHSIRWEINIPLVAY